MITNASLYGKGIFTTIAIVNGVPFLWDKHWRRLTDNSAKVGIDLSAHGEDATCGALRSEIAESRIADGRARITFLDETPSEIWPGDEEPGTTLQIMVGERRPPTRPFRITSSQFSINSRSPLAGIKSCNYLENILGIEDAKRRGCHEAIRLNEHGRVAGACMANVFWLKGDRLYTPALSTGCLPGTTREFVLENIECAEVTAEIRELEDADAVFLTSAGLGVVAVDEFDGRRLADSDHPILHLVPPNS